MNVPLLDLKPQYAALREELDRAVGEVVASQGFILGPVVDAFEAEMARYVGVPHAIGCASGTDALLLPLKALDPEPGDEVILPAFTFFATAGAVWNAGFTPVFCDIDPVSFNVTRETVEAVWSERTRAVIPVHLFGQMAPVEEILALAHDKGGEVLVLEDAAQAIGAKRRAPSGWSAGNLSGAPGGPYGVGELRDGWIEAGAMGHVGAFSFFPSKNLGAFGDAGLVTTLGEEMADRVGKLRVHGGRQMYHHEMVGTNSRIDALQAAVLRVKLPHLDGWAEARRKNARFYDEALAGIDGVTLPETLEGNFHVYNQYTVRADRRDELKGRLQEQGIGSGVYYPKALHLQECFSSLGGESGRLPHAEAACEEVLSLPIFPELGEERLGRVADAVRAFYGA